MPRKLVEIEYDEGECSGSVPPPPPEPVRLSLSIPIGQPNANGHVYPEKLMEQALEAYREKIRNGTALGPIGVSGVVRLEEAAFVMKEARVEGDHVVAQIETLPTPMGRGLAALVQAGVPVALVTTGYGSVINGEVQSDYYLAGFSVVPVSKPK